MPPWSTTVCVPAVFVSLLVLLAAELVLPIAADDVLAELACDAEVF